MRPQTFHLVRTLFAMTVLFALAGCAAPTAAPTRIPPTPTVTSTPLPPTITPSPTTAPSATPTITPTPAPTPFGGGSGMVYAFCTTGLYALPAVGSSNAQLLKLPIDPGTVVNFEWSPQGTKAVMEAGGVLYLMNPDGSGFTALTDPTNKSFNPRWSPDGSRIAYTAQKGGAMSVSVMNADGSNTKALTSWISTARFPTWSPDGKYLYYLEGGASATFYKIDPNGGDKQVVYAAAKIAAKAVTAIAGISPDGTMLLFQTSTAQNARLIIVDLDKSEMRDLALYISSSDGQWAPDGKKIYFSSYAAGRPNIYVVDADGQNRAQLTSNAGTDGRPVLSPDGTMIAYFAERNNDRGIYLLGVDGIRFTPLLFPLGCNIPSWQP